MGRPINQQSSKNIGPSITGLFGRHYSGHTRNKRRTHSNIIIGTYKTRKRGIQSKQEKKSKFYQKETIWFGHKLLQDGIWPNKKKLMR